MLDVKKETEIDLTKLSVDQLKSLIAKAEELKELKRFEEELNKAVTEYQTRDPRVIRF